MLCFAASMMSETPPARASRVRLQSGTEHNMLHLLAVCRLLWPLLEQPAQRTSSVFGCNTISARSVTVQLEDTQIAFAPAAASAAVPAQVTWTHVPCISKLWPRYTRALYRSLCIRVVQQSQADRRARP